LICPQCSSEKAYHAGWRYDKDGKRQRFLCQSCGYRFVDSIKALKVEQSITTDRHLCAILEEKAKKMDPQQKQTLFVGDRETKGQFVKFLSALENDGIQKNTARLYVIFLKNLVNDGAVLLDPDSVKAVIAKKEWDNKTKALAVAAYAKYLSVVGGTWKKPKYRTERKIPYVPTEKELDSLIDSAHRKLSAYLLLLKDTGFRSSEAWSLKWQDVDFERNIITLNDTLKHGTARQLKVSSRLIAVLNNLPKTSTTYIFQKDTPTTFGLMHFSISFRNLRKRTAIKLQNPNLNRITFHTFRHWYATMLFHKTKSLPLVQERLGHKSIETTTIYTHMVNFEADDYHSATAKTVEEARKLIEAGFEYVTEIESVRLFRKPK
jgi:integrase